MDFQTSLRDFAYTAKQPRRSSATNNMVKSLDLVPLERPPLQKQLDVGSHPRSCRGLPGDGRTLATSLTFKQYRKTSTGDPFGGVLAYISSKHRKAQTEPAFRLAPAYRLYTVQYKESPCHIRIGRTLQPLDVRLKQIRKTLSWCVQTKHESKTTQYSQITRLERIILETLHSQRRTASNNSWSYKEFQWFETDRDQVAKHIDRWLQWLKSNPYDNEGALKDPWVRRINYFTSHQQKLQLLAETSPFQAWSVFLDPTWWLRLRTNYYWMTLRQITKTSHVWSSTRSNLRVKYDESSYGQARKSSRVRKSIRAQVEAATPEPWSVHAIYGMQ
ncbi:MAG: hypothetical protein Q9221_006661 [Calogaya cf. arnoldii]